MAELLKSKPRAVKALTHRRFKQITVEEVDQLVREYCDGVGSVIELAKAHGVSETTVAHRLRERGLELGRLSLSTDEIEQARELRKRGLSFNAIGRMLNRDPKTIKNALGLGTA